MSGYGEWRFIAGFVPEWTKRSAVMLLNSFLVLTAYVVLGAAMFSCIEHPVEMDRWRKLKATTEVFLTTSTERIVNRTLQQVCRHGEGIDGCFEKLNLQPLYNESFHLVSVAKID